MASAPMASGRIASVPRSPRCSISCRAGLSGNGEVVSYEGDELTVTAKDGKATTMTLHGLAFAAPLRADGHDEIVAITRSDEAQARVWSLVAYRFEGIRLVRSLEPTPV